MLSRSIRPAANRWRNASQSSKRVPARANVSCSANRSCSSQASSSHFMIYIVIWFSSLGGTCSKSFLWTQFVGIFILTLKQIGLSFTLEDVGIFSFQLYSSRVVVFISQPRLPSHTLNFLFLYQIRPVESVIGQSNDTEYLHWFSLYYYMVFYAIVYGYFLISYGCFNATNTLNKNSISVTTRPSHQM